MGNCVCVCSMGRFVLPCMYLKIVYSKIFCCSHLNMCWEHMKFNERTN